MIGEKSLPQILTSWDRLQRLLRETIDETHYHLGHTFERVERDGSGVIAHFAGGRSERADILIGGDGIRSSVRAQVAPAIGPVYAGYYIWRGAPNEADLKPKTRVTKSTTALPSTIGSVSRLANASCCTGASSAPTSV